MSSPAAESTDRVEVIAGVVRDEAGRILLAQRPPGKHLAGTWEFPGGKREDGESDDRALARELAEELDIEVVSARPWLSLTHRYPDLAIRLKLHTVDEWRGQPRGLEGQALDWVSLAQMSEMPMPAADRPIVRAFGLDDRYAVSPDPQELGGTEAVLGWVRSGLERGLRLFQLRAKSLDPERLSSLARAFGEMVSAGGGAWLLHGPPEMVADVGADGVHLDVASLRSLEARPLTRDRLVIASCLDEADLSRAGALGLDFVTLCSVLGGSGADASTPLGWDGFERLCRNSPLPVYALGGLAPAYLDRARERGGFGVAGTRAFGEA